MAQRAGPDLSQRQISPTGTRSKITKIDALIDRRFMSTRSSPARIGNVWLRLSDSHHRLYIPLTYPECRLDGIYRWYMQGDM